MNDDILLIFFHLVSVLGSIKIFYPCFMAFASLFQFDMFIIFRQKFLIFIEKIISGLILRALCFLWL